MILGCWEVERIIGGAGGRAKSTVTQKGEVVEAGE